MIGGSLSTLETCAALLEVNDGSVRVELDGRVLRANLPQMRHGGRR